MKKVWIVGAKSKYADKSFEWNKDLPNLSDPDILIINLDSLTIPLIGKLNPNKFLELKIVILDKFLKGDEVIFILPKQSYESINQYPLKNSNLELIPICLTFNDVSKGEEIIYNKKKNTYSSYLESLKEFHYYIEFLQPSNEMASRIKDMGIPIDIISQVISVVPESSVCDNANRLLGCEFQIKLRKGRIMLLPPFPTLEGTNNALDKLLNSKYGVNTSEPPPSWIKVVDLPTLLDNKKELKILIHKKNQLMDEISSKEKQIKEIEDYYKLIYSKNYELEEIVYKCFKIIGIDDIRQDRPKNLEDGLFNFKYQHNLTHAIIEIKGDDTRTGLNKIALLEKWVSDYTISNIQVKGIFISNQHRLKPYPDSKDERMHYEPNELEYATKRNICILPACVLFDYIVDFLKGNKKSREELERIFLDTKGLLTKI